ncbi:MAG: type IV toxin-antitoxin system AbiEi family antitoxin domain-containing protein [Prevotellaceae bacterium]|nr:type IV toxin-antitoxin system AbiEi family antitoxin domain-containing protein [Prevotellaceae bacterium]
MTSIEDNIWSAIKAKGRGSIFFPSDFTSYGEVKAVDKSLERLTARGEIVRLARGIYTFPKIDTTLGLGLLMPSIEQIAQTIARRDKARIVPTGIYAMNKLGLSTQVPMNVVYLTDGAPRKVNLGNGRSIQFKYTTPKNLSFTNPLAMLVTFALKEVGHDNMTDDIAGRIKSVLQKEKKEQVLADEALMPAWIRTFTRQAYE